MFINTFAFFLITKFARFSVVVTKKSCYIFRVLMYFVSYACSLRVSRYKCLLVCLQFVCTNFQIDVNPCWSVSATEIYKPMSSRLILPIMYPVGVLTFPLQSVCVVHYLDCLGSFIQFIHLWPHLYLPQRKETI